MIKRMNRLDLIFKRIKEEYLSASLKFPAFASAHEGYAVILEELDELWENVKLNQKNISRKKLMIDEAIQVAAMAIRFIIDAGGFKDE